MPQAGVIAFDFDGVKTIEEYINAMNDAMITHEAKY